MREALAQAAWTDGRETAGWQSAAAKHNRQLPLASEAARDLAGSVLAALDRSDLFQAAALPRRVWPPMFNRYGPGEAFGDHVDAAVRRVTGSDERLRTDISGTLFLTDPGDYEGGELVIDDTFGAHEVKLPAGDLILYPASSAHRVEPVTAGERLAAVFWVESLIRDDARRALLLDLDRSVQALASRSAADDPEVVRLTGVYHNLVRQWAET